MSRSAKKQDQLHPIQVVARRTGLSPDVLRAWERRYEAIVPSRSTGSRRLYSDEDVERLTLLRRATNAGRSIGQVAGLTTTRLRALIAEDEAAARALESAAHPAAAEAPAPGTGPYLELALDAVRDLDVASLETAVGRALIAFGPLSVCDNLLVPLMRELGDGWHHGSSGIVHEHMASAVIRTVLGDIARSQPNQNGSPGIVVATPSGSGHELGSLMAVVNAVSCGWIPTYLGPNLPAEEIAAGAEKRGARAIALGITFPHGDPAVAEQLVKLRRAAPHTTIIVGGDAAASYRETLDVIRALRHDSLGELRETLARISPEAI